MAGVDNIKVRYEADLNKLKSDLNTLESELRGVEGEAKKSGKQVEETFTKSTKSVNTFNSTLKDAAKLAGTFFAVEKLLAFGKGVVDITAKFQKFEAVLTNTLGSKSKAQEALNMIKEFAASTPFSVEELTASFVKLANQGFKPTKEEMTKLGDLASAMGKSFDMLTEAIIDAQTGEFERLKEFGIRASKEGDKVTFTFKGVKTQTDFTADSIRKYVLSLGDLAGVSGGMAAISKTLGGQISNLGDSFDALQVALGSGLSDVFSGLISMMSDALSGLTAMVTSSESATDSFYKQRDAVASLEQNTVPLLDRYDELKSKATLNKDEQKELDEIIVQIGKDIPTAITQFDEYGKAMGISSEEARKFVNQQKEMLAVLNKEAIKERTDQLDILKKKIEGTVEVLNKGTKSVVAVPATQFTAAVLEDVRLTSDEIVKLQTQLGELQSESRGTEAIINDLKGIKTEVKKTTDEIQAEADKKKAEEEKAAKEKAKRDAEEKKRREKELKEKTEALKKELNEAENFAKQKFLNNEISEKDLNKRLSELEEEFRTKEIALLKKYNHDTSEIEKQGLDEKVKQKKDAAAEKLKIEQKRLDDEFELAQKEIDGIDDVEKSASDAKKKREEEDKKQRKEDQEAAVDAAIDATNMILDAVQDAQQRKTDAELLQSETQTDNELKALEKRKENGTISEEQFQKRKETILAAGKKREGEIKTKDAQNDKKLALFRIALDTAVAIVKAAPNLPLMAIAGVLGAIQAGIVASTPIPKFAKGVTRFKGKGTNTSDSNLAFLSNNESVINAKASIENEDAIDAMNKGYFRKYVEKNHVLPALQKMQREKQKEEANFGSNVVNMMKLMKDNSFYDGNIVRAIKRKDSYAMSNVNELAKAISKTNSENRY